MKRILLAISLLFCLTIHAQTPKAFIGKDGSVVDSSKAASYIVYNKVSDTVWVAKQYGVNGVITMAGTYRDANLSIPNGRFFYYNKMVNKSFVDAMVADGFKLKGPKPIEKEVDTSNYIQTIGEFHNGMRSGLWTEYFPDGRKSKISTYKNDKLNGLCLMFYGDTIPSIKGNYVNDVREGEWYTFSKQGNLLRTEFYEHGKVVNKAMAPANYVIATPPDKYIEYIGKNLSKDIKPTTKAKFMINATVTKSGKLVKPSITEFDSKNPEIKDELLKIISDCPLLWAPPYDAKLKQVIEGEVLFSVEIENGDVKFDYSSAANTLVHQAFH